MIPCRLLRNGFGDAMDNCQHPHHAYGPISRITNGFFQKRFFGPVRTPLACNMMRP
jgi:hypothetical protein